MNTSPLGLLFRTFRRNSPLQGHKWKDYLAIKDNEKAISWAQKHRKGESPFDQDSIWIQELDNSDQDGTPSAPPTVQSPELKGAPSIADIILSPGKSYPNIEGGQEYVSVDTDLPKYSSRTSLTNLNFRVTGIGSSGVAYDFESYSVQESSTSQSFPAWKSIATTRGIFEIELNQDHEAFKSVSLNLRDAVLSEMAHVISLEESQRVGPEDAVSFGDVLVELRKRYVEKDSLEMGELRSEAEKTKKRLTSILSRNLNESHLRSLIQNLPKEDIDNIDLAYAKGPEDASIVDYLELRHIDILFRKEPALFFNSGGFIKSWSPEKLANKANLLENYRKRLVNDVQLPLSQICDFLNPFSPELNRSERELIRACINHLNYLLTSTA